MNLWLRLLWLLITAPWRPRLDAPFGASSLFFRVWPHDLDTNGHMNNGRYLTIMDLGRADFLLRSGLWRQVRAQRWMPVLSASKVRFRRELRLFQRFRLESRVVWWSDTRFVMEHRLLAGGRAGETLAAIALVLGGLYDRRERGFVPVARLFGALGRTVEAPSPSPEVAAFIEAEKALKQAA
ncbi:thioesterase family protein [Chelatococcus sp. SYSU_G07232]|uniref:Thioesterase family protein n=1 Tax=Chelatococcus albus TaxID=3047466 RepID=A0ABT7AH57_9HYPH|nr:thioesterase family protein [Chelatococcus sp. SYSU_G07232]MDJ1157976.1 thioesterase family protein [Chelatococcus sp. SYSU_G07232]